MATRPETRYGVSKPVALSYLDPELSDEVLTLRPWSLDHLDCVHEADSDPAITRWTAAAGRAFIHRQGRRVEPEGISLAMPDRELGRAIRQ